MAPKEDKNMEAASIQVSPTKVPTDYSQFVTKMPTDAEMKERLAGYEENLPEDKEKAWKLLSGYSKIPEDNIESHLRSVRDRAWSIFPYRCIGGWHFLDLYVTTLPEYPVVVQRLKTGDRLLDAGCCFGYVLRQLAFDGVPTDHLAGSDLVPDFIDLGYDLFRDRDTFSGEFVAGDMLDKAQDGGDAKLASLNSSFDIIHAASFFHLFSWEDQVRLGERIVRFFRPASKIDNSSGKDNFERPRMIFGRQVGLEQPVDRATLAARGQYRFHHNPQTLQQLWDEIGEHTGTQWRVDAQLVSRRKHGRPDGTMIRFAIYKK